MIHGRSLATITGRWLRETLLVQVSTTWALTCPETVKRLCVEREMEIVNINVTMHDLLVFRLVLHKLTSRSSDICQKPFFFSKRIVRFFVSTKTGIGMAIFTTCTRIMITITHKSHPHQCRHRCTHIYLFYAVHVYNSGSREKSNAFFRWNDCCTSDTGFQTVWRWCLL